MPATIAIPRPGPDEHSPYFGRYVELVPGEDALPALRDHGAALDRLARSLTEPQGRHRYAPDKWSVKEVLGHVADAERVFAYRALRFARGDGTPLAGFDENAWAPEAGSDRRPVAELADELRAVRAASVALFAALDEPALARRGVANGQEVSVRALAWIIAGHARHHATVLRERYGLTG